MPNKRRALRLAASAFAGILVALSASYIETERPLGILYDRLLERRTSPSFPRELLLIETPASPPASTGSVSSVKGAVSGDANASANLVGALLAMTEMEASRTVVLTPIGGSIRTDGGVDAAEEDLERRFDEEFGKIERNISTLFDAIKLGSIRSKDSSLYVSRLIALVGDGKSRLIQAAENRNLDAIARFERAAAAFGEVWLANDVSGRKPAPSSVAGTGYSRLPRDGDGALRRIIPVDPETGEAHVALAALRDKLGKTDFTLPLDRTGAFLVDAPRGKEAGIRRLPLDAFDRYAGRERKLYLELKEMERAGYFDSIDPSSYPTATWEYAEAAKEEMLKNAGGETRRDWRESRDRFLRSVKDLFAGETEASLLAGYDALLDSPTVSDAGKESVRTLRDAVESSFARSRSTFAGFTELREELKRTLQDSFCMVGYAPTEGGGMTDAEASAILVADLVTERHFRRADFQTAAIACGLAAFALAILLILLGGIPALVFGILAAAAAGTGSAALFLYGDLWISPAVAAGACLAVTIVSAGSLAVADAPARRKLRRLFRHRLPKAAFARLMENPDESLLNGRSSRSVILAVRANGISLFSEGDDPSARIRELRSYASEASRIVTEAGGTILGADGDLVFAAFASPVDEVTGGARRKAGRKAVRGQTDKTGDKKQEAVAEAAALAADAARAADAALAADAARAADAALAIRDLRDGPVLRVGLDIGTCAFGDGFLGDASSFAAFGSPAVRARLLSSIASRYEGRILVTEAFRKELGEDFELRALDLLVEQGKGTELAFHELIGKRS